MIKGQDFSRQKFSKYDFSEQKLQYANFKLCTLEHCSFVNTDLKYADFSDANCIGCDFTGASLNRSNFTNASLEYAIFKPRDAFGITMTLRCETFHQMEVDDTWLECWVMLLAMMKHPEKKNEKSWLDKCISMVGPERYVKLKAIFDRRVF